MLPNAGALALRHGPSAPGVHGSHRAPVKNPPATATKQRCGQQVDGDGIYPQGTPSLSVRSCITRSLAGAWHWKVNLRLPFRPVPSQAPDPWARRRGWLCSTSSRRWRPGCRSPRRTPESACAIELARVAVGGGRLQGQDATWVRRWTPSPKSHGRDVAHGGVQRDPTGAGAARPACPRSQTSGPLLLSPFCVGPSTCQNDAVAPRTADIPCDTPRRAPIIPLERDGLIYEPELCPRRKRASQATWRANNRRLRMVHDGRRLLSLSISLFLRRLPVCPRVVVTRPSTTDPPIPGRLLLDIGLLNAALPAGRGCLGCARARAHCCPTESVQD